VSYEDKPKGNAPDFVYTLYIAANVETVWNGLVDKEITQKYWGRENRSDWQSGSKWEHIRTDGSDIVDVHGHVVEANPPNKLVVTWNGLESGKTKEPAPSLVTYELTALGPDTKLTVTHSLLTQDSIMHKGVTEGWPAVLSNLKSVLETGRALSSDEWDGGKQEHPDDTTHS
jgi:uncharacterized protein YndB with AHSA1/START domain